MNTGFLLKEISVSYADKKVLNNFSAIFPKGEITVIMGPSGCGKTTLLRLLLGLKKPEKGLLEGPETLRCGTVFQEDRLCESLSAIQNINLVYPDKTTIQEHLAHLDFGKEEFSKPVRQLSGGQRRRVALVRAVLFSSDFLVLDEPFKGLDADTRALAIQYIFKYQQNRGIILVTHDSAEAEAFGGTLLEMKPVE